jgi:predicted transcriptional regulator
LKSGVKMRRSKLEMYIDILKVLSQRGPLKLTHIMYKANVNCSVLKEYLDFLIQQELVEEKVTGKTRIVYAVSEKGLNVLRYFRELKIMLPVIEEGGARLPPSLY